MLQWVIDEAHGWPGFCRIELECVAWNTNAIGLYESLGFKVEGRMVKAINLRGKLPHRSRRAMPSPIRSACPIRIPHLLRRPRADASPPIACDHATAATSR